MKISLIFPNIPMENTATVERCHWLVTEVFTEIARRHGEKVARKIFAPYGRPITAHDRTLKDDARLLLRYYQMPKRSKRALAKVLVKEGRKKTVEAAERWIKLLTNPKEKRAHAAHERYESLCIELEDEAMRNEEEVVTGTIN
jgi:hypothetical protein